MADLWPIAGFTTVPDHKGGANVKESRVQTVFLEGCEHNGWRTLKPFLTATQCEHDRHNLAHTCSVWLVGLPL